MKNGTSFDKVLGNFSATAISIGGIIGSGIFFIIGRATGRAGPAVILSLIIAGVIALLTSLSFASLGSKIVKEGGEYQFVYVAFGPKVGFWGGLLWISATAIAGVTVSMAFSSYLTALIPVLPLNITASLSVILFTFIDILGLRISSKVNNLLVLIKVGVILFFIFFTLPLIQPSNLFNNFFEKGSEGILSGTFLIFFAYAGFGKITAASEEVKNPERTIPRAIITAVAITILLYILSGIAAVGAVGAETLSQYRNAPLANVLLTLGFEKAFLVVAVGALTATASVLLIQMLSISRTAYAMSMNKQLPSFLSKLHPKFKTPYRAEIIIGSLMAIAALFVNVSSVIALTSLGILSYYSLINLAALVMKRQKGGFNIHPIIPILGFLSSLFLIANYFLVLLR
jgi:APA family basic amino acid/polyamine antiporter